jgi:hypothetical protein
MAEPNALANAAGTLGVPIGVTRRAGTNLRRHLGPGGVLLAVVLAVLPLAGCNSFQTMTSSKWLETSVFDTGSNLKVNHVLATWEPRVRTTQDAANGGVPLNGLVGRLYLLNDETSQAVDARGMVYVRLQDISVRGSPQKLAEWKFDAESLKRLKRRDGIAEGYTLFLPWETYRPEVRKVQLQVCYVPEGGSPYFGEPTNIALQSEEEPELPHANQIKQATNLVPKR